MIPGESIGNGQEATAGEVHSESGCPGKTVQVGRCCPRPRPSRRHPKAHGTLVCDGSGLRLRKTSVKLLPATSELAAWSGYFGDRRRGRLGG
eukprot:1231957-Rhodomonas_salina.5